MTVRAPDPATHRCDVPQIDYSLVEAGFLQCSIGRGGCGRSWSFHDPKHFDRDAGWRPSPVPFDQRRRSGQPTPRTKPEPIGDGPW